jgi:hypothetical protein
MKTSLFKQLAALLAVVAAVAIVISCRKNSGSTDLIITPPKVPGVRQLTVAVLSSASQDTLSGYSLHIVSPSGATDKTVSGNRYVISNPEAGTYTFTASLNGYIAGSQSLTVILPADETASLILSTPVFLTKSAPAVAIQAASGGTVAVKQSVEQASAPVVATVTVPPAVSFTLPNGTKPATVDIAVTNIPSVGQTAPSVTVGGEEQVALKQVEIVNNGLAVKKMDLQPEGLTFDKPMNISMYIGDIFQGYTVSEKTTLQQGMRFDYVKTDGSVESVLPDKFSTNRDTIYFNINHFSQWTLVFAGYKFTQAHVWSPTQTKTSGCGEGLPPFSYTVPNLTTDPYFALLLRLLRIEGKLMNTYVDPYSAVPGIPGYSITGSWKTELNKVTISKGSTTYLTIYLFLGNSTLDKNFGICHNQGGGK